MKEEAQTEGRWK